MKITVVGLGKIGLPLAVQFAGRNHHVVGADVNPEILDSIRNGIPPFPGEADLQQRLEQAVRSGSLEATSDTTAAVAAADAVVVVVPLYADTSGVPDYTAIDEVTDAVGRGLHPGVLVTYETTLPVGTTRNRIAPRLESASGLRTGEEFFLAFSPERVSSGRVFADLARYPKLIGGVDSRSAQLAVDFYNATLQFDERHDLHTPNGAWDLGSAEAAELAKLAETTYRDVNIGLANQFALYAHRIGVDFSLVAEACNSQPYSHIHRPGIAVGGHCIPVYPWLYLHGDSTATIVRAAREANHLMPERCVELLADEYGDLTGAIVVVLGACYRGGVKETAFSGVFAVTDALEKRGAIAVVQDPLFSAAELSALGLNPHQTGQTVDAAIVQADHIEYASWAPPDLPGVKIVFDGRDVLDDSRWLGVTIINLASRPKRIRG